MKPLSHLDADGNAHMVDVSGKERTARVATAVGYLHCSEATLDTVREGNAPKGAVLTTAELAGIMAAKQTSNLIPLCHPLALSKVSVVITEDPSGEGYRVESTVKSTGQTGVEMEALTAVSVACLTLFDMLKAVDRTMRIDGIEVLHKSGGQHGNWMRDDQP